MRCRRRCGGELASGGSGLQRRERLTLDRERLHDILAELATRPGHEKVRALTLEMLVNGLGVPSRDVDFERPLPEVRGRADALLGQTVFEFKRDLRRERGDAEEELSRYLADRERQTSLRFIGIATDGAEFAPYELRRGRLVRLPGLSLTKERRSELLAWLDTAVSIRADLDPTPEAIRRELGRDSLAYERARAAMDGLWTELSEQADVRLRRQLWSELLARVYGTSVDQDDLFFQHTFLTIVAKTMAARVLGVVPGQAADLLAGSAFSAAGIHGAVESDFFNWVLDAPGGSELVERIAQQASRFRLADVETDVLRGLYESLVDPTQRHDLGEYYTPDWLAERVCARAVTDPLEQRVLDPACGSGTFLFHAVRRFLAASRDAGLSDRDAVARCSTMVLGIDVHPVAVIIARVTYLLALGEERLREHDQLSIPVYLGDSLQWNTHAFLAEREVLIDVPDSPTALFFPFAVTRDPALFDEVVDTMLRLSAEDAGRSAFAAWLSRRGIGGEAEREVLGQTYATLHELRTAGKDHIWGYVARNQGRPIWLSSDEQRADVLIGNPPWLSYRYMAPPMQDTFRAESQRLGVWVGGAGRVSHQDPSGYFFARCVELYLRQGGTIAFVMPFAALSRHHFERFRSGRFAAPRTRPGLEHVVASVRFVEAWGFDERVQPLFPVPSCVLVGIAGEIGAVPPPTMFVGDLPRRDATAAEAAVALRLDAAPAPEEGPVGSSPYKRRFRAGAIVFPRMMFVVARVAAGRLGADPSAPLVTSRRSRLEKPPWRDLPSIEGRVEAEFLRPLYLGESVAPFRVLDAPTAVISWDDDAGVLLDRNAAQARGSVFLAAWLRKVEDLWAEHGKRKEQLVPRLDYFGQLSAQLPGVPIRVVYGASGTLPAAAVLRDPRAIVEHKLYWAAADEDEARYLEAILNSETARAAVALRQSRGQWGARDFDKVMLDLPIPTFDRSDPLHCELVQLAERAERIAADTPIPSGLGFVRVRALVREAIARDGLFALVDAAVAALLLTVAQSEPALRAAELAPAYGPSPDDSA